MFTGADQLWFETLPDTEDLVPDIVARAERTCLRNMSEGDVTKLSIRVFAKDTRQHAGAFDLWLDRTAIR